MNNQKLIAIFMASIMVVSILPFLFGGSSQQSTDETYDTNVVSFDTIPGEKVDHEFNSIIDALEMTPEGFTTVQFLDIEKASGTPITLATGVNVTQENAIYNSNVNKLYFAYNNNYGSWFKLHEISPEVVAFQFYPLTYNEYSLLSRSEVYNVIGTPTIFGMKDSVESVIDVLSGDAGSTEDFALILKYVDEEAEFQLVTSDSTEVAEQLYMDLKMVDEETYSRTVVYLNPTESTIDNLNQLSENAVERGLEYEITTDGDITKVVVTSSNFYELTYEQLVR